MLYRLLGLSALFTFACILGAQTADGTVSGNVTDPSGSGVPNAKVTLKNSGTQVAVNTQTNGAGFYTFQFVVPGTYQINVEATGFQREVHPDVHVEVAQSVRQDFALQVGQTQQEVTVTGGAEMIQTDNASIGTVISQRAINELPLNGRNPLALVALAPGVVPQGQSQQNAAGTNNSAYGNFSIGGGAANQSNWMLDGATMVIPFGHAVELLPSQDVIKEFNVLTNDLPPQYGGFAGGVVNLTTKTGSNDVHGDAYEYLRNKVLNANTFFNNEKGVPTGAFTQNQFGGTLGGPVVIPHLYNGKNKTFFFVNYEGFRLRQGQGVLYSVPTQAMRNGDFSGLGINIYNPFTTTQVGNTYTRSQASCNGRLNVICPSQIDPVAAHLVSLWALPNVPGAGYLNNWAGNVATGGNTDQGTIRIDHAISETQHLFWRYTYWADMDLAGDPFHNQTYAGGVGTPENYNTLQTVLDYTNTLSAHTVMDIRADLLRFRYVRTPQSAGFDATSIGWPAYINQDVANQVRTLPNICMNDTYNEFCGGETGSVIAGFDTDYEIAPSVTTVHGHHTFNFGAEWRAARHNYGQTNNGTGGYTFTPAFTAGNPSTGSGGGLSFASFLYGAVNQGSVQEPAFTASQQVYRALYFNDTWQVSRKLTVNAGLRWEITGPWTERFDSISVFSPNATNPLAAATGMPLKGDIGFVASPGHLERSAVNPEYHEFSPRVGVAYMLTPSTVIRTGYGIFWLPIDVNLFSEPDHDSINAITESMNTSLNNGITPFNVLSNPFPGGIIPPPQRNADPNRALYGQTVLTQIPQNPLGYAQQWNFDIQKQFGPNFLIDAGYAGSKGTHLPIQTQDENELPIQLVQQQAAAVGTGAFLGTVPNPFAAYVPPGSPFASSKIAYEQLLRPFPTYGQVQYASQGDGDSSYQSFQLKVTKRFGNGGTALLAYTNEKLIDDAETLTPWLENNGGAAGFQYWGNFRLERSLSSYDVSQRLVLSYVVDLPFGKGRKYMSHPNKIVQAVAGGWGLDGILTLQTGFPIALTTANNNIHDEGGGSRPDFNLSACPNGAALSGSATSRLNGWFNTSCFFGPPNFTLGTVGRTLPNVRTDGLHNLDFALFKDFDLTGEGRAKLQLRGESFNLLNTPQFGYPGQTCSCNGGSNGNFGVVTSQVNNARLIQVAAKLIW